MSQQSKKMQPFASNQCAGDGFASYAAGAAWKRWIALISMLLAEFVLLSLWFDTGALTGQTGGLAWIVGQSPIALRFGIVVMAIMLGFSAGQIWQPFVAVMQRVDETDRRWALQLSAHVVAFTAFAALTHLILETDILSRSFGGFALTAWLSAFVCAAVFWASALMPFHAWWTLIKQTGGILAVASVIGVTALISGVVSAWLWRPMSSWTLALVQSQLALVTTNIDSQPAQHIIGTGAFSVQINGSCSGYEGIGLIWVFLASYFWFFRNQLRFPHAFVLAPIATVAIWVFNSFRITTLILIGSWGWPEIALGGFHSQAGWLAFCGVGMAMVAVSNRSSFLSKTNLESAKFAEQRTSNPAAPFLVPFLMLLVTTMVIASLSNDTAGFYPVRVAAVCVVLWYYRRAYLDLKFTWS